MKMTTLLSAIVVLLIAALVPLNALAQTDAIIAENNAAALVNALVVALLPIVASVFANLTEKKPTDNPWLRLVKNAVNVLALNFNERAGK